MVGVDAQLIITMTKEGGFGVEGCIDNKIISYLLLECARDVIRTRCETKTVVEPTAAERLALLQRGRV